MDIGSCALCLAICSIDIRILMYDMYVVAVDHTRPLADIVKKLLDK